MTPPAEHIPFPQLRPTGFQLTDDEHTFLNDVIRNFHGGEVEDVITKATHVSGGGRQIGSTRGDLMILMEAVGIEAAGFFRLEEEKAGRHLRRPKKGGTSDRLFKIYDKIEAYLRKNWSL
jgi:hypothetical protein